MQRIRARQIIHCFRSGMGDDKLMKKYGLSRKGYQRLLRTLVSEKVIEHGELYERSPTYKAMADILSARHSPRVSVPLPVRVYHDETSQKGFVRDISENGFRVAGIEANVGEAMTLRIPLNELAQGKPLEFDAVCRWSKTVGKTKRYVLSGFDITDVSEEARSQLLELLDLFSSQSRGKDRTLYASPNVLAALESASEMGAGIDSRQFSGTVDGTDILDFVQFLLLSGKKTRVDIQSSEGDECELHLEDGRVVQAVRGKREGKEAFFECMNFPGGKFSTRPWNDPGPEPIDELAEFLLFEAARRRDESSGGTQSREAQQESQLKGSADLDEPNHTDRPQQLWCYPFVAIPIYDRNEADVEGMLIAVSESGVIVKGISASSREKKALIVRAEQIEDLGPFGFEAECLWTRKESDGQRLAGFKITDIGEKEAQQLKELLQLEVFFE